MWETRSVFQGVWEDGVLVGFPQPVSFHSLGSLSSEVAGRTKRAGGEMILGQEVWKD